MLTSFVHANWIKEIVVDRRVYADGGAATCDWDAKAAWSAS
jgi:hypothetical protein